MEYSVRRALLITCRSATWIRFEGREDRVILTKSLVFGEFDIFLLLGLKAFIFSGDKTMV